MKLKLAVKSLLAGVGVLVATLFFATPANAAGATVPTITIVSGATTTSTYGSNPTVVVRVTDAANNPNGKTMTVSSSSTLAGGSTTYGTCPLQSVSGSLSISECTIVWATAYAKLPYSATAYTMYAVMPAVGGQFVQTPSPVITATINKAPVTYTAPENVSAITYGAASPTMTAVPNGFFSPDGFISPPTCAAKDVATGAITYAAGSDAGDYNVVCSGGSVGVNYVLNTASATATNKLVVNKRTTVVTATPVTVTYGDPIPTYSFTFSNKYSADQLVTYAADGSSTVSATCTSPYTQGTVSGTASITCSQVSAPTNYTITSFTAATLTINKRNLTLTGTAYNKTYGDAAEATYTFSQTGSFYGTDGYTTAPSCTSSYTDRTAVASSPVTVTCSAAVDTSKYNLTVTNGSITIARKALHIVATSFPSLVYGDSPPSYTYDYEAGFGLLSGTSLTTAPSCTSSYTASTPVASSPVPTSCTGAANNNYSISYTAGAITINKRALSVTADNVSVLYGATKPTFNYTPSGFLTGQSFTTNPTCNATYTVTTPTTYSAIDDSNSTIPITCTGGVQANYEITYYPGQLTVGRRTVTVTANNKTVTYGDTAPAYDFASPVGFQNSETFASVSGTAPTCGSSYTTSTHVSSSGLPIVCSGGSAGNNYVLAFVNGALTINRYAITVTPTGFNLVYGDAVPSYTSTHTAFIDDTTFDSGPSCTSSYSVTSAVGSYSITCSATASNDYSISYAAANVVVAKRDLRVTTDSVNVIYGSAVPTYTYTVSATGNNSVTGGFVNGQSFASLSFAPACSSTYSPTTAALTAGLAISCSGNTLTNYNISYTNTGLVTVAKRDLSVTARNVSVLYGATKPGSFAYDAIGWVNGDSFSGGTAPTCDATYSVTTPTTLAAFTNANTPIDITCSSAVQNNYNITYHTGGLTVNRRPLTVTATSYSVTYGDSIVSFGFNTPVGFQNLETYSSISGSAPTCTSSYTNRTGVALSGMAVTCSGGDAGNNYTVSFVDGAITIGRYAISVVAQDKSVIYGSSAPTYTNTSDSLLAGDSWTSSPSCSAISYTVTSHVGTLPITCTYTVSSNYNVTVTPATLTVTKRDLLVTPVAKNLHYGDSVPTYNTSASATGNNSQVGGWVNGDGWSTPPSCASSYTVFTNVADAVGGLTISCTPGSGIAGDYNITYGTGTLTIAKRVITMIANPKVAVYYGDAKPSLKADDYVAQNFANGDRYTVTGTCFSSYAVGSLPGNYPVTCFSFEVDANYEIKDQDVDLVVLNAGNVQVQKKNIEVSAKYQQITYGDSPDYGSSNYNYTPFYSTETFLPGHTPVCTAPYSRYGNIGQYTITCDGAQVDTAKYTLSYVTNVIDVSALSLIVTATTPSAIYYGQASPSLTYNTVAFVNGETFSTPPNCTSAYSQGSNANNYTITCSGGIKANYLFTYVNATLVVGKRALQVTVGNKSVVYGDSLPTFNPTTTGWYSTQDWVGVAPSCSSADYLASAAANTYAGVGTYELTCSGGILPNANYTVTYVAAELAVTARPVTVTGNSYSRTYGSAIPSYSFSSSGFMVANPWLTLGGVLQIPVCGSSYTTSTAVGSLEVTCTVGNAGSNYTVTYQKGTFTITKKDLTVTADSVGVTYGNNPIYGYSEVGFINGDVYQVDPVCSYSSYTRSTNVGTYSITCDLASHPNYNVIYVPGTLTVQKRALVVTANDLNVAYGTITPNYTVSADNWANSETFTTPPTCSSEYTPITEVSNTEYTITCSGAVASNYSITYRTGILKVTGRNVYVTYNRTLQYGASISDAYLPQITGLQNGDVFSSNPTCTSSYASTMGVGSYETQCSGGTVTGNYLLNYPVGHVTVVPRTLYVRANDLQLSYGTVKPSDLASTATGFQNGESFATAGFAVAKCVSTYSNLSSAGSVVAVTCSNATVSGNYDVVYQAGTITVLKKDLQIKANAMTVIYGSDPLLRNCDGQTVMHCYNLAGFVNGDSFASNQLPACSSGYTSRTSVAVYTITCTSADLANYNEIYVSASLTVLPKRLTVAAPTQTVVYGDSIGQLLYTASGWVNGDSFSTQPSCFTFYTDNSNVGTYKNYTYCKSGVAANYDVRYYTGTITVVPRTLTITATKTPVTYGTAVTYFRFTANGFANNDGFKVEPLCTSIYGSVVRDNAGQIVTDNRVIGTYDIICHSADAGANYLPRYTNNVAVVSAKQIVITAVDKVIEYGTSNPSFNYTATDFAYGDSFTTIPRCTSTYRETSTVGPYVISCIGAEAANYSFVYLFGTVNVIPRQLTIRVKNVTVTYGDDTPTINADSYTVDSLVNGDQLTVAPSCSTIYTRYSNVNANGYNITCSGAEQPNYDIQYVSGKITVNRFAISVTPHSQNITYGAQVPTYQWTVSHALINDDTYISEPNCTSNYAYKSNQGIYDIVCSANAGNNYSFDLHNNTAFLTVNKKALTVTPNNQSRIYGQAIPTYTYETTGFVEGDAFVDGSKPVCTSDYNSRSDVQNFEISCSGAYNFNYTIDQSAKATLTVSKRAATITGNDFAVTYGQGNPVTNSSYTIVGLVNSDTLDVLPVCTTSYRPTSNVGNYSVVCNTASDHNYDIAFVDGALTVSKKHLTISALNRSVTYGAAADAPNYSAVATGWENGDGFLTDPTCGSSYVYKSSVGTYTITCNNAEVSGNYEIDGYVPATLTVGAKSATFTPNNKTVVYGNSAPEYDLASTVGILAGDTYGSVTCTSPYNSESDATTSTTKYIITCSGAVNSNYDFNYPTGHVLVDKRVLYVTGQSNAATVTYGDDSPSFSYRTNASIGGTVYDFVNGDSFDTAPTCHSSYEAGSNVGDYVITCTGGADKNYEIRNNPDAKFTVGKAGLLISYGATLNLAYGDAITFNLDYFTDVFWFDAVDLTVAPVCEATYTSTPTLGSIKYATVYQTWTANCQSNSAEVKAALPNYSVTYVTAKGGAFDILKRVIRVAPVSYTIDAAAPSPAYALNTDFNFAGTDTWSVAPTCESAYTVYSSRGTYPITCSGGQVDSTKYVIGTQLAANVTVRSTNNFLSLLKVEGNDVLSSTSLSVKHGLNSATLNFTKGDAYQSVQVCARIGSGADTCTTLTDATVTPATICATIADSESATVCTITVTVTAESGSTKTYTIALMIEAPVTVTGGTTPTSSAPYTVNGGSVSRDTDTSVPGDSIRLSEKTPTGSLIWSSSLKVTDGAGTAKPPTGTGGSTKFTVKSGYKAVFTLTGYLPGSYVTAWIYMYDSVSKTMVWKKLTATTSRTVGADGSVTVTFVLPTITANANLGVIQLNGYDKLTRAHRSVQYGVTLA